MKKSFVQYFITLSSFFILFFLCSIFCSCVQEKGDAVSVEVQEKVRDFIYEYTLDELKGSDYGRNYLPENIHLEFSRSFIKDSFFYTGFELCFSDKNNGISVADADVSGVSDIYDCHSDNGEWVDRILFSVEEERIGQELGEMEELVNTGLYGGEEEGAQEAAENEKKIQELIAVEVVNVENTLEFMEYGKEIFIPQKNGDNWILINAFNSKVSRSFYDKLFRCYKEEKWEIDNKGKEDLTKTVETVYFEDSFRIVSKTTTAFLGGEKKQKTLKNQLFNDKGLLAREENFLLSEHSPDNDGENKKIISQLDFKYDEENRITESNVTEFNYDNDDSLEQSYSFNKKYLYKYNGDDIPADFDYYEDGKLKIRNIYKSANTYRSQIFFDEDFSVETFYENGKIVKEVFVTGEDKKRIKNHE